MATTAPAPSSQQPSHRGARRRRRVTRAVTPLAAALLVLSATVGTLVASVALPAATAGAAGLSVLDAHADSGGPIVTDSSGNGYVAWQTTTGNSEGDPVKFCKIPRGGTCTSPQTLPIPGAAHWGNYDLDEPYVVIGGKAGVVSVVSQSYDLSDVVVWTSTNSGSTFGEPQTISGTGPVGTGTDDVLRSPDADAPYYPDYFDLSSSNPGLFFDFTGIGAIGAMDPPVGFEQNTSGVAGSVTSSTLGYGATIDPGPSQSTQTVQVFATDATTNELYTIWSPTPGVSGEPGTLMHGPSAIAAGTDPRLAGGPDGLYLVSVDNGANSSDPLKLDVRVWNSTTETFGSPTLVADLPNDIDATNIGGIAEDSSTGAVTVAWPMETSSGNYVMETWTSTNGAATFSGPTSLAEIPGAYAGPARIAMTAGAGFVTWEDSGGLELVDLPISPNVSSGPYSPLTPVRVCDTRPGNPSSLSGTAAQCNGTSNVGTTLAAGGTETITVAGAFSVPSDATAVVLNVAAVGPAATGYLTVYPSSAARPTTSNLNYSSGQTVDNLIEVGTGSSGAVTVYSSASSNVVVDLEGYVAPGAAAGNGAGLYVPLGSPARLCDTRAGNPSNLSGGDAQCNGTSNAGDRPAAGGTVTVKVAGNNGVPTGATAAVLNVTAVGPAAAGFVTVYPAGTTRPTTANVNVTAGQNQANRVIVSLPTSGGSAGKITVYVSASADVLVDVSGYYTAAGSDTATTTPAGSLFSAEPAPVRICDTRPGNPSGLTGMANQCDGTTLGVQATDTLQVTGLAGVPAWATAVVVNLTAIDPSGPTYLAAYPAGNSLPDVSDVNPAVGKVHANLTVVALPTDGDGTITIYNNAGSVDVAVDVLGWYS